MPEIAGKKITLSYAPATASDEAVINSYLPKLHADGTPIQSNELPSSLPAYLIQLKPELRIDGVVIATGGAIGMGEIEDFNITITQPNLSAQIVNNMVIAGEFNAVALAVTRISNDQITAIKSKLDETKIKLEAQEFSTLSKDDILGDMLFATVLSYFAGLDAGDGVAAFPLGLRAVRLSSVGRFFMGFTVEYVFGTPLSMSAGGLSMDVGLIRSLLASLSGDNSKKKQFMLASGMNSSALEHAIPEQLFSTSAKAAQGLSAIKALTIANEQGIPIYTIDQSNISNVLPQLQIDSSVKVDISNAVNAGKLVTVSKSNIVFNGWTGCGYIVDDPTTGAGAFLISGGINGAWIMTELYNILLISLQGLTSPAMANCLLNCVADLSKYVVDVYTNCLKFIGISCVAIGIVVPSIIVLFEPYLLPALLPAILLVTGSCLYMGVGLCNIKAGVSLLAGMLGCISGCGGY